MNSLLLFLTSIMLFAPVGCRTTEAGSGIKDSNFSNSDPAKPSIVLWLASDGMVHHGSCPVGSTVVDRNCPNIAETEAAIKEGDYKEKITERIKLGKPKPKAGAPGPDAAVAQALLVKIDRIKTKLANGGLTPAETTNFQKQLDDLNLQYANARVGFSAEEQSDYDKVVKFLEAGQDITYDEGERLFNLALSPFAKGFSSYRIVFTAAPTTCSNTVVVSEISMNIGAGVEIITIAAPTNGAKESAMLASQALEMSASSSYSGSNSVARAVSPNSGGGWAPKAFLDTNGVASTLEYLQFDFPNVVPLSAIAFSANNNCQASAFHVEGSTDATNFSPVPNAEWKGKVFQTAKQVYSW